MRVLIPGQCDWKSSCLKNNMDSIDIYWESLFSDGSEDSRGAGGFALEYANRKNLTICLV